MPIKTYPERKLSMLMACASPGSALAFHLGLTSHQAGLPHRTIDTSAATPAPRSFIQLLLGAFGWVERWGDKLEQQERERYLAQAQNVADLEARLRDLQSGRYWLP